MCPYLRSYITALCAEIFKSGEIPDKWKRDVTILMYIKGPTDNPENFRLITLECACLKIYTTILRDKIGSFLKNNRYIAMKEAKKKQRSLTVTLIDLRNAFELVRDDHDHMPPEIIAMIQHMYTDFYTATDSFVTEFIHVGKGVLQGDCLSPLLFYMVINIQRIKSNSEPSEQLGYTFLKYLPTMQLLLLVWKTITKFITNLVEGVHGLRCQSGLISVIPSGWLRSIRHQNKYFQTCIYITPWFHQ